MSNTVLTLPPIKNGQTSVVLRFKILDSSVTTGAGKTGLLFSSTSLIISTIADNEAAATTYTSGGSTTETIATLGTYAAPTSTKCRFKEVDSTNHPGTYELQIADARFAVANAKSLTITLSGVTNMAQTDLIVPLTSLDPYDAVRAGLTSIPNAVAGASGGLMINGTNAGALTEAYAADGSAGTINQLLYEILQSLTEFSISGTTVTAKKRDGSTTAAVYTLDSATNPSSRTRSA